jgi:hypothetical protein
MILPIVGERFVETAILFFCDIGRIPCPQRLGLVELLDFLGCFLDFLGLLFLIGILIYLFDLGFLVLSLLFYFLFLLNFLFNFFGDYNVRSSKLENIPTSWMGYEMNSECFLTISLI